MKKENKNGFLITWISCIVLLLVLCFFGVSDSLKGTSALGETCPVGYKDCKSNGLSNCECYKSTAAVAIPEKIGGYCTCQSVQTGTGSCTCETAAGTTYAGTCNGSSCSCGSGGSVFSNSCHGATTVVSGECIKSGSSAICDCGVNNVNGNQCTFTAASYGCDSGWTQSGSMCYMYANYEKTADEKEDVSNSDCSYDPWSGEYRDSNGKVCSIDSWESCPAGYYDTRPENATSCDVKILSGGNACFNCVVEEKDPNEYCGEGTHLGYDESGKMVCLPDCECDNEEDCEGTEFCWNCSGKYFWGLETEYSGCSLTYKTKNNCSGSGAAPESSSSSSRPSSSSSSSRPSSSSSSSRPSSSSSSPRPSSSDSNNYINRGEGCYQNKDTNEYKWFESDPEIYSQTKLYEKVNDSKCETIPSSSSKPSSSSSSSLKPSSSENVIVNPQTGEMMIFIIWVLGFAAAGYSVWYYIKGKKEN